MRHLREVLPAMLLVAAFLALPRSGAAQWSFEGRIGSALPVGDLTDPGGPNQTGGLSFAADGMYTFQRNLSAYAGFSHMGFRCDGCRRDVTSTGIDGGLKYLFTPDDQATPWIRGGLILHRASLGSTDQDWGLGVDAGVGIDWLVTEELAVVPALRVNSYSSGPMSLTYVTIDLGLHFHP